MATFFCVMYHNLGLIQWTIVMDAEDQYFKKKQFHPNVFIMPCNRI